MANKTIGGQSPLDRLTVDDSIDIKNDLLAIWNADPDQYTNSVTPEQLVNAVVKDDIDSIKKDLGGDPYIAFSTDWGIIDEEAESNPAYQSIYDNEQTSYYPTYAEKEIRYIEADIKELKDNFNDQIESLKKDLGYDPTEGAASTYHSINGDNENPNYQSAYHWLSSLQEKVVTPSYTGDPEYKTNIYTWLNYLDSRSNWPSTVSPSITKGNAYSWLSSLDITVTNINGNFARKYWDRYWSKEKVWEENGRTYTFPYKAYEKDERGTRASTADSPKNGDRIYYYFGLQNDGNLVLYRSISDKHGDGPADIGSDRQWIWQTGSEYEPAIFKITALFNIGTAALNASNENDEKTFTLKDAINKYNTFDAWHRIQNPLKPSYFIDVNNANDFSILSVKYIGKQSKANITLKDLYIDYKNQSQKIVAKITKDAETATTIGDTTVVAQPAYIKLQMIIARNSNIPDPQNYPNT